MQIRCQNTKQKPKPNSNSKWKPNSQTGLALGRGNRSRVQLSDKWVTWRPCMCMSTSPIRSRAQQSLQGNRGRQAGASTRSQFPTLVVQHFNSLQYHFETFSYVNLCTLRLPIGHVRVGAGGLLWRAKDEICAGLEESTNWSGANMIFIFWELNYFLFQSATVDFQLESIRDQLGSIDRNSECASRRRRDAKECEGCVCPRYFSSLSLN